MKEGCGLVLVWDLDQTIVDNGKFNERALEIIGKAIEARKTDKVAAILLLTNNSSVEFVNEINVSLWETFGKVQVFDNIWTAARNDDGYMNIHRENDHTGWAAKRLVDVEKMLKEIDENFNVENLANRTYFFDDLLTHVLTKEIPSKNFIHIQPFHQETDYSAIETALGSDIDCREPMTPYNMGPPAGGYRRTKCKGRNRKGKGYKGKYGKTRGRRGKRSLFKKIITRH
jgi:uncharacterized cupredoxin-like copper-binding protein